MKTEEFGSKLESVLESHLKPLLDTENFMKTEEFGAKLESVLGSHLKPLLDGE